MENLTHTAEHVLEDFHSADLSQSEKKKISREISTALAAMTCLVAGLIYKLLFPQQAAVAGLIYSVGVLIEGVPLLITAVKGFMQQDVVNAMEILVTIAVLACYITGQHELAILIPVVLSVVHFLEERSIMGGRDAIEGLKNMQASTALLPVSYTHLEQQDLNRSFPGDPNGTMAERVADSIYQDIAKVDPIFLFDLHEARANKSDRDFLGSSLIYTSLDKMSDMYMDLLMATETGDLCSERFNFYGPGPVGSINNTVTTNLEIPTITVETYRGYPLERRIGDQLAIVQYVLTYYGLL